MSDQKHFMHARHLESARGVLEGGMYYGTAEAIASLLDKAFDAGRAMQTVEVEYIDQLGTSHEPAEVTVYDDDKKVSHRQAIIESKKGADGGWYPCVVFKVIEGEPVGNDYHIRTR